MRGALSIIQSILTLQHQNEMTLCLELKDILFSLCIWELNIFIWQTQKDLEIVFSLSEM